MELQLLKDLLSLAVKNPSWIIPILIAFCIFLVLVAGKYRAKILEAVFDKLPFGLGKRLESWYKGRLKEETEELDNDDKKQDEANLYSPNMPVIDNKPVTDPDPNSNECPSETQNRSNAE